MIATFASISKMMQSDPRGSHLRHSIAQNHFCLAIDEAESDGHAGGALLLPVYSELRAGWAFTRPRRVSARDYRTAEATSAVAL